MNIDDALIAIRVFHAAGTAGYIWGPRGLGKTQGIRSYCKNSFHFNDLDGRPTIPYGYRDMRCAQLESSDLRGLPDPDRENQRTNYLPPQDLPHHEFIDTEGFTFGEPGSQKPDESPHGKPCTLYRGILALEELNRAEDDVLQAAFELILDRKCGGYTLPTGWIVVGTGNPAGDKYRVNSGMMGDAAMMDRWVHIFITVDDHYRESWMRHMIGQTNLNAELVEKITQFCAFSEEHLITKENSDDMVIEPSPRSWELVAKLETAMSSISCPQQIRREILAGVLGTDVASSYISFAADIMPQDIIDDGITDSNRKKLVKLERSNMHALVHGVGIKACKMKPTDLQVNNVIDFAKFMLSKGGDYNDLVTAYCRLLTNDLKDSLKGPALVNPSIQRLMRRTEAIKSFQWLDHLTKDPTLARILSQTNWGGEILVK